MYLFGDRDSCGGTQGLGFPFGVRFEKPGIVLWSVFRLIALLKNKGEKYRGKLWQLLTLVILGK